MSEKQGKPVYDRRLPVRQRQTSLQAGNPFLQMGCHSSCLDFIQYIPHCSLRLERG